MIIGIHGKAQSGKDTLGDLIYRKAEETGKKVVLLSFAEPVKQLLMSMYGLTYEDLYTEEGKRSYPPQLGGASVRDMLISLGQGLRALLGYGVWVQTLLSKAQAQEQDTICVVTDIRDALEYSALEAEGAITIKLLREIPSSASGKRMEYTLSDRCFDHVMDNREMGREEFLSASTTIINEILRSGN